MAKTEDGQIFLPDQREGDSDVRSTHEFIILKQSSSDVVGEDGTLV